MTSLSFINHCTGLSGNGNFIRFVLALTAKLNIAYHVKKIINL